MRGLVHTVRYAQAPAVWADKYITVSFELHKPQSP